ncbi:aspartyl/glutamyl-tRNA(Asn/Gln) amidotransferase subunit C [Alicyclobacillus hesperidum]|uniref:Aspartyl/glutamyl-tRNA(Asn/Gln) amidotransferase subunit C n=1 Tax=Alicyclobacillus hesperidum TaxID=89784 RepID=A0A1H2VAP3_9BACL|nr:Asp-tRNA(Asn)/Glu-tRNA(Gln) amidotransferase subunit GatC [Alicyclobacillus hesperidum]GLV14677.1 aspartyl/glutamyl-tRNA(Asn/Gln) amidotransferase subunit C [Alicyclobacillus hesperidum]SDW65387.1 aspartyl/glutamyl-tRNA(Asn/Gln) amidotransferase subunit C [Alicyclobacillus hesperidum]
MKITAETVSHVARLARLAMPPEDLRQLAPQLSDILEYAEQLQQVQLDGVEPTSHPFHEVNVLRDDVVRPSLPRDLALANAPEAEAGQVRVPAVLEGGGGA